MSQRRLPHRDRARTSLHKQLARAVARLKTDRSLRVERLEHRHLLAASIEPSAVEVESPNAWIGDFVWSDENADGIQDENEAGIAGVRVNLHSLSADGSIEPIRSTETSDGGRYHFGELEGGVYIVQFVAPEGYRFSPKDQITSDGVDRDRVDSDAGPQGFTDRLLLEANQQIDTIDAGLFVPRLELEVLAESISEGDGEGATHGILTRNTDPSVPLAVELASSDTTEATVPRRVEFPAGAIRVEFPINAVDDSLVDGTQEVLIIAEAGGHTTARDQLKVTDNDEPPALGSLGDRVWLDLDANGIQEEDEPGVAGVRVNLLSVNGPATPIRTTETNSDGKYRFGELEAGRYVVHFVAPDGHRFSPQDRGTSEERDSDANRLGFTEVIALEGGDHIDHVDAGLFQRAVIGDRVWNDVNGDGIQGPNEPGLREVGVRLIGNVDDFENETLEHWGTVPSINPGALRLAEGGPAGPNDLYLQYFPDFTGNARSLEIANDHQWTGDFRGMAGITADVRNFGNTELRLRIAVNGPGGWFASSEQATVRIPAGSSWTNVRFSLNPDHFVGSDPTTGAGIEATLADVSELRILGNADTASGLVIAPTAGFDNITGIVRETQTNPNGIYRFEVNPGTYVVQFLGRPGSLWRFSPQYVGINHALDSNADPETGLTDRIVVSSGEEDRTIDAGLVLPRLTIDLAKDSISEGDGEGATTGIITRHSDPSQPLVVELTSSDVSEARVPERLEFAAGVTRIEFPVDAVDDPFVDGTQFVLLIAETPDHAPARAELRVTDDDGAKLRIEVRADEINEGDGPEATTGIVIRNTDSSEPLVVELTSSDTTEAKVPERVEIPAGSDRVEFPVGAVDDLIVDGTQLVVIAAFAAEHEPDRDELKVTDNDEPPPVGSIGDRVWRDDNFNGIQDDDEPGMPEVQVNLLIGPPGTLAPVRTTTTNNSGNYRFDDLPAGDYWIQFVAPESFRFSPIDQGDNDLVDSDARSPSGLTERIRLEAGEHNRSVDAGIYVPRLTVEIDRDSISEAAGPGAATAIVTRHSHPGEPLVVELSSSDTTEALVPQRIEIAAGDRRAEFPIDAIDDLIVDGTQLVVIAAEASGHRPGREELRVTDNDLHALRVEIRDDSISEGDGEEATIGVVIRSDNDVDRPLVVELTSSDTTEAKVPERVEIPAGASQVEFPIHAVDDSLVDGTQLVVIAAHAEAHARGREELKVTDDDEAALRVELRVDRISEGDGEGATRAFVIRNTDPEAALLVELSSSDTTEATVPERVEIPAGHRQVEVPVDAVDDLIVDGTQTVVIAAKAEGHLPGRDQLLVTDDDSEGLVIESIESSATIENKGSIDEPVEVRGSFVSSAAEVKGEIDWGDGTITRATIDLATGTFSGTHEYSTGGIFTITVTVVDDAGAAATARTEAVVTGVNLRDNGVLDIVGSAQQDAIIVRSRGSRLMVRYRNGIGAWQSQMVPINEVRALNILLCDGSDMVRIDPRLDLPARISAGAGNDIIRGGGGETHVNGGLGDDTITTRNGDDTIVDLFGNNVIQTRGGNDKVHTGAGDDIVRTHSGNDVIVDEGGTNLVHSGWGDDEITTGDGVDQITADRGHDVIRSGGSRDIINAGSGDDLIESGAGNDVVNAGNGDDLVRAGDGNDVVNGAAGNDILLGESGDDRLTGAGGRDVLIGGLGQDILIGRQQDDILIAGTTDHDEHDTSLRAILNEWTSSAAYENRVGTIRAGTGSLGGVALNTDTVHDDRASDTLTGSSGRDWFFAHTLLASGADPSGLDLITDQQSNEELDQIN